MGSPSLRAEDLRVERGGVPVLEDVSVTVERSSRVLVRGPSGAGKTTLFYVFGLLEKPTDGRLFVDGTEVTGLSERRRARLRRETLGVVFQDFQLVPDLTAWENAALPQDHVGERDEAWLETLFDRLDIADLASSRPAALSGGEKQRVAIARALANRPAILLADEPTGQLDPETTDRVVDLLVEVQELSDAALLAVSHDPQIGDRFTRHLRLSDGGLREQTAPEEPASTAVPESE